MSRIEDTMARHAADVGVELDASQLGSLSKYLKTLAKWNERINLVGTRSELEQAVHHVVDSLAVLPHMPAGALRAVDVGSGAGLPGAIVAIMRPDAHVVALEPIGKKLAFLATVRREIPVGNLEPRGERLEVHLEQAGFRPYDVAMSRATFAVGEWLERGRMLVKAGGLVIAMEGAEKHVLPEGAVRHPYHLRDRTRAIITLAVPE